MNCWTCKWAAEFIGEPGDMRADCHRRAPSEISITREHHVRSYENNGRGHREVGSMVITSWPSVKPGDWCGEYEPKEEAK